MAIYCLESSALVKRYVAETGTAWIRGLASPTLRNTLLISLIAGAEVVAAIALRSRRGATSPQDAATATKNFRHDFVLGYNGVPASLAVVTQAMTLAEKHGLRGYDAVQFATALQLHLQQSAVGLPPLFFLCADTQLNAAATAEGLAIDNPNAHS